MNYTSANYAATIQMVVIFVPGIILGRELLKSEGIIERNATVLPLFTFTVLDLRFSLLCPSL